MPPATSSQHPSSYTPFRPRTRIPNPLLAQPKQARPDPPSSVVEDGTRDIEELRVMIRESIKKEAEKALRGELTVETAAAFKQRIIAIEEVYAISLNALEKI